jgi:hypothetical protein
MTTTNTNESTTPATTTTSAASNERVHGDGNRGRGNAGRGGDTGGRGGGRGGGGRGGGGRGNSNHSHGNQTSGNENVSTTSKYKGKTTELEEHCFHTHSENPKRTEFLSTLEAIKMYAAKQYKTQFIHMKESIFENFEEPTINPPTAISSTATEMEKLIFIEDYKVWKKDEKELNNAVMTLFDVIVGQCSPLLRSKLKALAVWTDMESKSEVGRLLKEIKSITHQFQANISIYEALDEAKRQYYIFKQQHSHMNTITFMKTLKNIVDVIEFYGGSIADDPALIKYEKDLDKKSNITGITNAQYQQRVRDKMLAVGVLRRSDKNMYAHILHDMRNQYQLGNDCYPTNPTKAFDLLQNYHSPPGRSGNTTGTTTGLNFAQQHQVQDHDLPAPVVTGTNGKVYPRITCTICNQLGHYATFCPTRKNHQQHAMMDDIELEPDSDSDYDSICAEFTFAQRISGNNEYKDCILIDSGSSCSVFCDKSLLTNIRTSEKQLNVITNGGPQVSTQCGDFYKFFEVWYNPNSMLNILSWSEVAEHFRITLDSAIDDCIQVHIADGITLSFTSIDSGIYLMKKSDRKKLDPAYKCPNYKLKSLPHYSCANIVEDNKLNFTSRELEGADLARSLFKHLGLPSYSRFIHYIENKLIPNCPVTIADIRRALHIYGPEVSTLKGRTTRQKPLPVPVSVFTPIPKSILDHHQHITLAVDFFYVNGIAFLHSISHNYKFRTVESTRSRSKKTMLDGINKIRQLYMSRGVKVVEIRADGEFQCLEHDLHPCIINIAAPGEHVPEIERSIRTVKESSRTLQHDLPYKKQPKLMTESNVYSCIKGLNAFPALDGVSKSLSPSTLITGKPPVDFKNLMKAKFGDYAQVFLDTKNDMTERTVGAIALYPTGNMQSSWYFINLTTGKRITGYQWTVLPITDDVIKRVHDLAAAQDQDNINDGGNLNFQWRPDQNAMLFENVLEEDIDLVNADYVPQQETMDLEDVQEPNANGITPQVSNDDIPNSAPMDIIENNNPITIDVERQKLVQFKERDDHIESKERESEIDNNITQPLTREVNEFNELIDNPEEDIIEFNVSDDTEPSILPPEHTIRENVAVETVDENESETENTDNDLSKTSEVNSTSGRSETSRKHYNLRPIKKEVNYALKNMGKQFLQMARVEYPENNYIKSSKKRAKMNKKTGKGKVVIKDTFKKLCALCFNQMSAKKGIKKHGQDAINVILKEYKQLHDLGVFKPRFKKDLEQQQIKNCLRLITVVKEKRNGILKGRAVADGRPQRAYIPKEDAASPAVSLESLILSLMIDSYEGRDVATADVAGAFLKGDMPDFVLIKLINEEVDIMCDVDSTHKQYVTYEGGKKVLYMQLNKALYGCMKSAIIWYETFCGTLKDLGFKLNPYDPCVANKFVNGKQLTIAWFVDDTKISHADSKVVDWLINEIEKKHDKMTVYRGKQHTFLGMDIEFLKNGRLKILMKGYIEEAIEDFGEDLSRSASSPASKGLFDINQDSPRLCQEKSDRFHSIVAKLLYVCLRSRLDTSLAVAFLTTRVSKSTEQDWLKLKRLLRYLNGTIDMPRIIGAHSLTEFKTWVDAAYAVHDDMKSHTGGVMSFGHGVVNAKSLKQKLNVKSSTEAEVVGASDYLPWVIWVVKFMHYQGFDMDSNIFYQDNLSAMKIEKNGRKSCGQKSRHIDIRYFFIKDVLKRENITLEHCPTENMIADFYTKPLQGSLFRKMRDYIMGISDSLNEERVENSLNKSLVESENEMGLREDFGKNVPRIDNADDENVNFDICEITHKPKIVTYADIVKSSEKKVNNPSSHSLKIIQ